MSDYTPTTDRVRADYAETYEGTDERRYARFDRWLAEVERAAAAKALEDMAERLYLDDDGGRRGVKEHSKSSASAISHRRAMQMVRARAAEIRGNHGDD